MSSGYNIFLAWNRSIIRQLIFCILSAILGAVPAGAEGSPVHDPIKEFKIIKSDMGSATMTWTRVFSVDNEELFPDLKLVHLNNGDTSWVGFGKEVIVSTNPDRTADTAMVEGLEPDSLYVFALTTAWGVVKFDSVTTLPGIFGEIKSYALHDMDKSFTGPRLPLYFGCAADFNLDGRIDIAVSTSFSEEYGSDISLMLNCGNEVFDLIPAHIRLKAEVVSFLTSGDFNGDGAPDLIVVHNVDLWPGNYEDWVTATIYLNNGRGDFSEYGDLGHHGWIQDIAVVDFDHDGDLDMALCYKNSNELAVYVNNGQAGFTRMVDRIFSGHHPAAIVAVDFNGDGRTDLAAADQDSMTVTVFPALVKGACGDPRRYYLVDRGVGMQAVDLDGDTDIDLAVAEADNGGMAVFLNDGRGFFRLGGRYIKGFSFTGMCSVDLDNDGDIDLAAFSNLSGVAFIFINKGDGSFIFGGKYGNGRGNSSIFPLDFDQDGDTDLGVTNWMGNTVQIIINETIR